jgi:hypothetical protein
LALEIESTAVMACPRELQTLTAVNTRDWGWRIRVKQSRTACPGKGRPGGRRVNPDTEFFGAGMGDRADPVPERSGTGAYTPMASQMPIFVKSCLEKIGQLKRFGLGSICAQIPGRNQAEENCAYWPEDTSLRFSRKTPAG